MSKATSSLVSRKDLLGLAASFGLVAAAGTTAKAETGGIVGAWKLERFDIETSEAGRKPRWGTNPIGYLIYTASGRVSAILAAEHRPRLDSPKGLSANEAERTEALANFLAYAGTYEIRGDRVFHHVELSVFTNLAGTTLERSFKIEGDTLTIRTLPPEIWGTANVSVWKRT